MYGNPHSQKAIDQFFAQGGKDTVENCGLMAHCIEVQLHKRNFQLSWVCFDFDTTPLAGGSR